MRLKRLLLYFMSAAYVVAGINHFWHPQFYMQMMPAWLPWPALANTITGVAEIGLGLLLLFPATRNAAAWGLVVLLVAVFPANLQMALNLYATKDAKLPYAIARLPLQLVLIWWAYSYTAMYGMKKMIEEKQWLQKEL